MPTYVIRNVEQDALKKFSDRARADGVSKDAVIKAFMQLYTDGVYQMVDGRIVLRPKAGR